jgi:hypothetical protein
MTDTAAPVRIKRYPTRLNIVCRACGHVGVARVFLDQTDRLRCKACNGRNASIVERDRCAQWSRRRQGR